MARIARVVAPGVPHHITQRGNRKQRTFFSDGDFRAYLRLIGEWCPRHGVDILAYCLMPNHVHLIAIPDSKEGFVRAIAEAHRRYTIMVNMRNGWQGCLWQGRFFSFPLDESHLFRAVRYVELNPVRAGIVGIPEDYPWCSARAHVLNSHDPVLRKGLLESAIGDWRAFLDAGIDRESVEDIQKHQRTGRPWGSDDFVAELETETGRTLRRLKPGPTGRSSANRSNS